MINILVFGITDNPGGMESVIMNYYRNIDKSKFHFDFLGRDNLPMVFTDEMKKNGSDIYYVHHRGLNFLRFPKFRRELKEIFSAKKYDVLWFNECAIPNIDYFKVAKKCGIKKRIIHGHNNKIMIKNPIKRCLVGFFHYLHRITISRYATDFWSCSLNASHFFYTNKIINSNKHKIINNAIDSKKVTFSKKTRDLYRKQLSLEGCYVLGNVARLHFQKNQQFAIRVLSEVIKKGVNAKLLLVGQGEDETKLKELINSLNLNDRVMFLGSRYDVYELLCAMDAFIFPSVFEGLGIASIEAQAIGLKVYNSDNVPLKCKICENVKFLPLNVDTWVKNIVDDMSISIDRSNSFLKLKEANYDIAVESKHVEKYFDSF